MFRRRLQTIPLLLFVACSASGTADQATTNFEQEIAPLLARRCLECHNASEKKGGLDLTRRERALAGGESGKVLIPGDSNGSLLWRYVDQEEMPPDNPLADNEKLLLRAWIASGAPWSPDVIDRFLYSTDKRAGYDWWSLQPVQRPRPPQVHFEDWTRNPIDTFVVAQLAKSKLTPSPEAARRTLIRRLYFDLLGLPPTPDHLESFLSDKSPLAYDDLVDELLSSPHYGERWARHWLDIVRYGESQGFERDKLRDNAWQYRDWVINALNDDLPYDEFARQQLAGDVLHPNSPAAIIATGMLVAGPYDEVGQKQQSQAMKAVVRQDELEDIVSTVSQTFLGLTVNCARCHDHKFDPIPQKEYYQLTAALAGVWHGERGLPTQGTNRVFANNAANIQAQIDSVAQRVASIERPIRTAILANRAERKRTANLPTPIADWDFDANLRDSIGSLHGSAHGQAALSDGRLIVDGKSAYVATAPLPFDLREKTLEAWVKLDDLQQQGGSVISVQTLDGVVFDAIVFGEREPKRWMAGSNSFQRTQPFRGPEESEADGQIIHVAIVYETDGTITGYRNGRPYGEAYKTSGPVSFAAGKSQVVFGLRHGVPGGNRLLAGAIDRARLYDRALSTEEVAASAGMHSTDYVSQHEVEAQLPEADRQRLMHLRFELEQLGAQKRRAVSPKVYAVTPQAPGTSHLLIRGNPAAEGEVVFAGGVAAVQGVSSDFGLANESGDAQRRKQLARWISDRNNPLFARVIVNRLWHYHFGTGLVETPSDFGFNGARPSHPKLLEWLAAEFIEHDFSIKHIQRLIVTSATYRQASLYRRGPAQVDAGNRLLWRMSPQRVEAESLRDAILAVSGQLNSIVGGPGFRDFTTYEHNSQFYEMLDPNGHSFNRRSIYRTWVRSGRSRFLDVFDCPDPSAKAPQRVVTTTPLQALTLQHNSFVMRMTDRFAEAVQSETGNDPVEQVQMVYQSAFARAASQAEVVEASDFVQTHGLAALCRVIFNSNEFLYVD